MSHNDRIVQTLNRQRAAAEKFLKDSVGCLLLSSPSPHICQAVAEDIEILCSFADRRHCVKINHYDLTHTLAEVQFRYKGENDFPICLLRFKPRMLPMGEGPPVFREDEYLMRAGIVLRAQSDNAKVRIESKPDDKAPSFLMDYTEERLIFSIGETSFSEMLTGFAVAADLAAGTVHGNIGVKFG